MGSTINNVVSISSDESVNQGVLRQVMVSTLKYMKNADTGKLFHNIDALLQLNKYTEYIERRVSFFEVEAALNGDRYTTIDSFLKDTELIFHNCVKYHSSEHSLY